MTITRREFNAGLGAVALAGGAIVSGLAALDARLFGQAAAQTVSSVELMAPNPLGEMVVGSADAPITIVEYASMTCPHCAHFHETTFPELKKQYIDTGKVRFIFREFPLDLLAAAGFMLARCAVKDAPNSDKYFGVIDLLFRTQGQWAVEKPLDPLFGIVKQAGFTQQSFNACLANQDLLNGIQGVRDNASQKLGVSSTPTFFINGKKLAGALTMADFEKEFQPYLKS